jgi:hypothetical protein
MGIFNTTRQAQIAGVNQAVLRQIQTPAPLPPVIPLQKFLTDAFNAEKTNLEPASMVINGFTLKSKAAAISINMIDSDSNNQYAEIDGTKMHFSGSLVKVAALYAAFELRAEARQHANDNNFSNTSSFITSFAAVIDTSSVIQRLKDFGIGLKPKLNLIFTGFKATGPNKVDFTANFKSDLKDIAENAIAGRIIRALGYSYINVSMIRGNFFDPAPTKLNGIWLAGDYSGEQITKSVRVPVENDTVPGGSGQAITTKEMSRMFLLAHTGQGFSHVTDAAERAAANQGMHAILISEGSFFFDANSTVNITVQPLFSKHCAKVGIGVLGPIGASGPLVISEGDVMSWNSTTETADFNEKYKRKLTGDFALCWQNMYPPNPHFDALVRIINTSISSFLTQ